MPQPSEQRRDKEKPEDELDIYSPQQGHERKIRAVHVGTPHGALRDGIEATIGGGQHAIRGEFEEALGRSGSLLEHDVIDVDGVLHREGLAYRTAPEEGVRNAPQIVAIGRETAKHVKDAVDQGYFPIVAGGDHATLIMGIPELLDRHPDPANPGYSSLKLVFIDAHPDSLQEPIDDEEDPEKKYTVGNGHGRTVPVLLGMGAKDLMPLMNGRLKLHPKNLMYVGISKPDKAEKRFMRKLSKDHGTECWDLARMRKDPKGFHEAVKKFLTIESNGKKLAAPFWAEMDPDVLRREDSKGTPMTSKVGMSKDELNSLALVLAAEGNLVGAGTAEIAPNLDVGGQTKACVSDYLYRVLGKGDEYFHEYEPHKVTVRNKGKSRKWLGYAAALAASIGGLFVAHHIGTQQKSADRAPTALAKKMEKHYLDQEHARVLNQFSRSAFLESATRLRTAVDNNNEKEIQDALAALVSIYQISYSDAPDPRTISHLEEMALSEFVRGFGYGEKLDTYYQRFVSAERDARNI